MSLEKALVGLHHSEGLVMQLPSFKQLDRLPKQLIQSQSLTWELEKSHPSFIGDFELGEVPSCVGGTPCFSVGEGKYLEGQPPPSFLA